MDSRLRERWFPSLAPLIIALVTLASAQTVDAHENPTPEIGQEALMELGREAEARRVWEQLAREFPDTGAGRRAREQLGDGADVAAADAL